MFKSADSMGYQPSHNRYQNMQYRRCGKSGVLLPAISLGLWQNFGEADTVDNCRAIIRTAFDSGITHFDLANNYGPPPGGGEETFGKIYKSDFVNHRDEMIISTKAGYKMWDGPYGDHGSKKYLVSSLDQSLKRMGIDYVDIFYHHRPDPDTPLEETMGALDSVVRQGKALYAGISNYDFAEAEKAIAMLKQMGTPCLIHQPKYSMFVRHAEHGLLDVLEKTGVGCIAFSTLAQGLLTSKYLLDIPPDSRAGRGLENGAITADGITEEKLKKIRALNEIAVTRGQTLAQMAVSWVLKDRRITSVILGASKPAQVTDAIKSLSNPDFTPEDLALIEEALH